MSRLLGNRSREVALSAQALVGQLRARESRHDRLTGLYRARFVDQIIDALEERDLLNRSSVISVDLVGIRDEVARHGSVVGDSILVALAGRLKNTIDEGAAAARLSFSEFAVVIPDVPVEDAYETLERIRSAFSAPVGIAGTAKRVPFQIGLGALGATAAEAPTPA